MIEPIEAWTYRREPKLAPVRDALPAEKVAQLRQDPHQAIHIAFPENVEVLPALWSRWLREGILRKEPLPALYAYSQTFYRYGEKGRSFQRIGIIGRLSVEAEVLPHEAILSDRLASIYQALRRLPVQATPIHLLSGGAWEKILPLLQSYLVCPLFAYGSEDGVMHRWTPIHHLGHQALIREAIGAGPFYIADGHHRWWAVKKAGLTHLLVYLTPAGDDSLIIVPTHRLLRTRAEIQPLLEPYFVLRRSAARVPLWQEVQGLRHAIGVVTPTGEVWTARLKPAYWSALEEQPLVARLHQWVLDKVSGELIFSREPAPLIQAALAGEGWAFILPELPLRYVERAAREGWTLPPKTTYFFPKVLSGLCFYYEGDTGVSLAAPASAS